MVSVVVTLFLSIIVLHYVCCLELWSKSRCQVDNRFDGCVGMHDREIYLNPQANSIPCGFLAPTELDIVRSYYIQDYTCKVIVFGVMFDAYDEVPKMKLENFDKIKANSSICFLLFIDRDAIKVTTSISSILKGETLWNIFVLNNLMHSNPAKSMKIIKLSALRLFPNAHQIIYFDCKYILASNPTYFLGMVNKLASMEMVNPPFSILNGKFAFTIAEEFEKARQRLLLLHNSQLIHNIEEELKDIENQYLTYSNENYFALNDISIRRDLLVDSGVMIYYNNEQSMRFFCGWLNEMIIFSRRDQLSFHYIQHHLKIVPFRIPTTLVDRLFKRYGHHRPANRTSLLNLYSTDMK